MGKETALPKNIRQIGDIRGREKICVEDYVMTYIRKKEQQEEQGYLGIFLGEKKQMEDSDYIFIRGILEVPDEESLERAKERKRKIDKQEAAEQKKKADKQEAAEQKKKADKWEAAEQKKKADKQEAAEQKKKADKQEAEELKKKTDKWEESAAQKMETDSQEGAEQDNNTIWTASEKSKNPDSENDEAGTDFFAEKQETLAERIRKECLLYFPEWEVQGCCVIGTYPAARMEALAEAVPESGGLLYHLQEQEESFYWMKDGQYQRIRGYFVFYEQNRLMQEYLAEVFGENSVEKESLPDRAIKNFREKIAQKTEKKRISMLKLASSFFVVTVLVIGAIMVNRVEEIRTVQNLPDLNQDTSGYEAAQVLSNQADSAVQQEAEAVSDTDDVVQSSAETADGTAQGTAVSGIAASSDSTDNSADSFDGENLAGSAAFWDDEYEDDAAATGSSASTADAAAATGSSASTADAAAATGSSASTADAAAATGSSASTAATAEADESTASASETANTSAANADSGTANAASAAEADTPDATEAASVRQTQAAYVIKEGDTLADICSKYYGSLDRLEEICIVNEIEDANRIMPGQKIVLP